MSIKQEEDSQDQDVPHFWTVKPDRATKVRWQEAVVDYLICFDMEPE